LRDLIPTHLEIVRERPPLCPQALPSQAGPNATGGLCLGINTLDDNAVIKRTKFHWWPPGVQLQFGGIRKPIVVLKELLPSHFHLARKPATHIDPNQLWRIPDMSARKAS
jgi:hypothetical protein